MIYQSRSSAIFTALTLSISAGLGLSSPASEAPQIIKQTNLRHRTLEWVAPSFPCSSENCPSSTHQCLANPNHPQRTTDDVCSPCQSGQSYWPCDVPGLCYCWDSSNGDSQIPPAPSTKSIEEGGPLENSSNGNYIYAISKTDPCDILTEEVFKSLAPGAVAPYTYAGFCEAVSHYNANHPSEGVFNMGSEMNQRMELAAFFGNALHESDEFKAGREYLMCADQIIRGSETYCKPCDVGSFDWDTMKCSASLASEGRAFNGYCQSNLLPPDACMCDDVYEEEGDLAGYVKADKVYFGRGSIQLSWNYNYIRASVALTGAPETFCQRPDLVATKEEYAWGAGLFYWMENMKNDKTCHQSVLMNSDFGETLDNINGGLECPADESGWHNTAVQLRLNRYCRAATALGLDRLLSLDGCLEMDKKMEQCLKEGNCDDCQAFVGKIGLLEGSGGSGANTVDANSGTADEVEVSSDTSVEELTTQQDEPLETEESSNEPTPKPTHPPIKLYTPQGPCSGEPCFIPPEVKSDPNGTLQFCRNAEGICGAGEAYCNAGATWTSFCHDCDVDSPYGCPTYGCSQCTGESQICVGNLNGFNPISDEDCAACAQGQAYWPCDITTAEGCWCYDTNLPRVEPAAPSGLELEDKGKSASATIGQGVCGVIIDETLFNTLAPNAVAPFTYQGFCESIDHYNSHHAEKVFRMGSYQERLSELAAFLGIASHETNGFVASREYLACGDSKEVDGVLYCKPCAVGDYNYETHTCSVSMLAGDQSYMNFCQPYTTPPDGCSCAYIKQVEATGSLEGHMRADDIFFGRGSIQLSHNFNYIRASASMTGNEDTFCSHPEMLASVETYSWGVGLYLWMDRMSKKGLTSHVSILKGNFGGALDIINGGSECPVKEDDAFYSEAVVNRLDHYCNAAQVLGVPKLLELGGCDGLQDVFNSCMANGGCPRCKYWDPDAVHTASPIIPDTTMLSTESASSNQNQPILQQESQQDTSNVETHTTSTVETEGTATSSTVTTIVDEAADNSSLTPQPSRSPTPRPSRKPRTKRPSDAPTPYPTKDEGEKVPEQASANHFAFLDLTSAVYDASDEEPQEKPDNKPQGSDHADSFAVTSQSKESAQAGSFADIAQSTGFGETDSVSEQTSQADTFAVLSHSKGSNAGASPGSRTKHPSASPVATTPEPIASTPSPIAEISSPVVEEMEPLSGGLTNLAFTTIDDQNEGHDLGEMTNWALTPLNGQNESSGTDSPTESPVENAINVQDIIFRPQSKIDESHDDSPVLQHQKQEPKAALDADSEELNMNDEGTIVVMSESPATGTISGRVWLKNEDGDEVGMRGILVDIFKCKDDDWVEGTRTSPAGDYIFDELTDGEYYIKITAASHYSFADDSSDSNVDSDGKSKCIELTSSESSHTVDVGLVKLAISSNLDVSDVVLESNIDVNVPDNCKGQPCSGNNECRSKHNFCGKGEEYCNSDSQWTPDCGTQTPTEAPTIAPSTGQPTFVIDLQIQCSGDPCTEEGEGTWCRSEVGFCGSGEGYCNAESLWIPECAPSKSPSQVQLSQVNTTTAAAAETDSKATASPVPTPSPAGERTDTTGFSSFALPTLTEITPNQATTNQISIAGHERTSINEVFSAEADGDGDSKDKHADSDKKTASEKKSSLVDSSWFEKYAYLDSTVSSGLRFTPCSTSLLITLLYGMM